MKKGILIILCLVMFLIGWFTNDVLQDREATAEKTFQYKVIPPTDFIGIKGDKERAEALENILNDHAKEGWRLHSFSGPIIFER